MQKVINRLTFGVKLNNASDMPSPYVYRSSPSQPAAGWTILKEDRHRYCGCASWKHHWLSTTDRRWPGECSVSGCTNCPTEAGIIQHPAVETCRVVPLCNSCLHRIDSFSLKVGVGPARPDRQVTCGL